MKKHLFTTAFLCLFATTLFGQEIIEVNLDEDNPCPLYSLQYANANISVCMIAPENNDNPYVSIKMENTYQSDWLLIYGHHWDDRELKRHHYVNKTGAEIATYANISNDIILKPSEETTFSPNLEVSEERELRCHIPIYIAREKKTGLFGLCKKTVLYERKDVELHINVNLKSDEDYNRISEAVNNLLVAYQRAIDNHEFCTNSLHRPTFKEQIKSYVEEREELMREIYAKQQNRDGLSAKQREKYRSLMDKLDTINFDNYEFDCKNPDKHIRLHSCEYCDLSLEQICRKLEIYFMDVNGNRQTKAEVMTEVEKLHTCAVKSTKNASRKKEKSIHKDKIEKFYNAIKRLP